jgi:penicillin-binding protein 1C
MRKILFVSVLAGFGLLTYFSMGSCPESLLPEKADFKKISVRDRQGRAMLVSYGDKLNFHDYLELSEIPEFLKKAFIYNEDKRFFYHHGADWKARLAAIYQNITNFRIVRGASTITEQVVRILTPRKRTLWSRWIEGFEAHALENKFKKEEILEFYLNEVPYAENRRGIAQASRAYFSRDVDTLNEIEMLCLAYLVRAPGKLDPLKNKKVLESKLKSLAQEMFNAEAITEPEFQAIENSELKIKPFQFKSDMSHFVNYIEDNRTDNIASISPYGKLISTIDSQIQNKTRILLEERLKELSQKNVNDGAVLILDNINNEFLAWVNSGSPESGKDAGYIDAVRALRQPGSALKPFLYALALENGWTASTILNDRPLIQAVGNGLHTYRNYSRVHYGNIRLREALGNSLNIPAILTIDFLGVREFYQFLHRLGFESLTKPASFYGEGLALGNGEVSLLELVKAYSILAKDGLKENFSYVLGATKPGSERLISSESASIISDILSDSNSRRFEFGRYGVFSFPMQTAVKTGTSTDFHDVWAIGYTRHYTVGIWMGNLNREAMLDVSGASGPGILLRSIFNELYKNKDSAPLIKVPSLQKKEICAISGKLAGPACPKIDEIFDSRHVPSEICTELHDSQDVESHGPPAIMFPTPGLQIAMDPRVPDENEAIKFKLKEQSKRQKVAWMLDGEEYNKNLWLLEKGSHNVFARVFDEKSRSVYTTEAVNFYVK